MEDRIRRIYMYRQGKESGRIDIYVGGCWRFLALGTASHHKIDYFAAVVIGVGRRAGEAALLQGSEGRRALVLALALGGLYIQWGLDFFVTSRTEFGFETCFGLDHRGDRWESAPKVLGCDIKTHLESKFCATCEKKKMGRGLCYNV